ncbi:hypothetical protein GYMLUDRAFT_250590 [Collybiopsis luxurians FD-317 M1]|uniref:Uncharacterized protein n=1 Tax=Collybiopsis luxurians FD-317 M1 TaxID=944289 RepID=A0A0D0ARZ1_9AGAR|nr:hypothetical protein GYMLUDRAFT_250590 [Collybiopsis luxurians FD-317 M1]
MSIDANVPEPPEGPIHCLAPEILSRIFTFCPPSPEVLSKSSSSARKKEFVALKISHVSRHWRALRRKRALHRSVLFNAKQAAKQRDGFVRDSNAILFTFVVKIANHELAGSSSSAPATQIVFLNQPSLAISQSYGLRHRFRHTVKTRSTSLLPKLSKDDMLQSLYI